MRRFAVPGVITAVVTALLLVLALGVASQGSNNSIDARVNSGHYPLAPSAAMALPVLGRSNSSESLSDFRGKVVLVHLFASWCIACQVEAPVLQHAERLLNARGGTVLGVTYQDYPGNEISYMRRYHLSFPVVLDANGSLAHSFGVSAVPESFVINRAGKIQALRRYPLTDRWVNETLPKILAEPA
jgi:cytochrome c biogenesis protein CcmG/thiol:disulfide interchange protein DsbE